MSNVEHQLLTKFCQTEFQVGHVQDALNMAKRHYPHAVKDIASMQQGISNDLLQVQKRLEYFLQTWKQMIRYIFSAADNTNGLAAASAAIIQQRASANGEQLARMLFRYIQILGDAVYEAAIRIQEMNRSQTLQKRRCTGRRCP